MLPGSVAGYTLPFQPGWKIIELGGGSNPLKLPRLTIVNADVRWAPGVDVPGVNLNYPLPFADEGFDGVYASFVMEHLSWRKADLLPREIHRILKPGGVAVLVLANLYEQCRQAVRRFEEGQTWQAVSEFIFGSQEFGLQWDAGAHHVGFSPKEAFRLFREAGFLRVEVKPWPLSETDMVIEAWRSGAIIRVG